MRQVTHFKLPHRINLISLRCPSLSLSYRATLAFALDARISIPNLLNCHKICASGIKNGDSLLLQPQALHNPNLEMSTSVLYNIRLERSFSIERFQSYRALKITVQPRGIFHIFSKVSRVCPRTDRKLQGRVLLVYCQASREEASSSRWKESFSIVK